jgi:sialate O-acetylesterase
MVSLPEFLGDHMVLQRDRPIRIWGWAAPGESVTVRLERAAGMVVADQGGKWAIDLPPMISGGPLKLTVEGTNVVEIEDVLVGDLWIASGQSNMEMPLAGFVEGRIKDDEAEMRAADYPEIRFFKVNPAASAYPLANLRQKGQWFVCTPETAPRFSAVAYFFCRELLSTQKAPMGVIDSTWGGSPAEAWISLEGLTADASLSPAFDEFHSIAQQYSGESNRWDREDAEDALAVSAGTAAPERSRKHDFDKAGPGTLFNGMIAPLLPLRVRGVLWYQGEANATPLRAAHYHRLFPALIQDWRLRWRQYDMPFLFVQLTNWRAETQLWPVIREAQRRALCLANTAMAVTIDVGDSENLHPPDKQTIGHRLALAARAIVYGEPIEFAGPMYREASLEAGALRIWSDHADGLRSSSDNVPGFEVAGEDGVFLTATKARIDGTSIVVSNPLVCRPIEARYGWDDDPKLDLYNEAGLPASPFSTELEIKS